MVVIVIIVVLAGISFTVFKKVRESAQSVACLSNMRQVSLVHLSLAQENNGALVHSWKSRAFGSSPRNWSEFHTIHMSGDLDWRDSREKVSTHMRSFECLQCPTAAKLHRKDMEGKADHNGWRTYSLNQRIGKQYEESDGQLAWIDGARTLSQVKNQSKLILLVERHWAGSKFPGSCGPTVPNDPSGFFDGHNGKTNVAFLDGHVESLKPGDVPVVGATPTGKSKVKPLTDLRTSLIWRGTRSAIKNR